MKPARSTAALVAAALVVTMGSAPVEAHHAFSANFDVDKLVEVRGRVTALQWQNPHVLMTLAAADGEAWAVESQAKNILERTEVTKEMFAVGTTVALAGFPARAGTGVFALNALLTDGREVILRAGRPAYFGRPLAGKVDNVLAPGVADAGAARTGLFRVWSMQFAGESRWRWPDTYPLTPAATAAQARFDPLVDDPVRRCGVKGMPRIMEQPYPMEIARQGEEIALRLEEGDTVRVIHLQEPPPLEVAPTPLGYSFARWDNDDLVVRTVALDAPLLSSTGIFLSGAATLDERFVVAPDGSRLNYTLTITDPATFTAPVTVENFWIWRPGERLRAYECTADGEGR